MKKMRAWDRLQKISALTMLVAGVMGALAAVAIGFVEISSGGFATLKDSDSLVLFLVALIAASVGSERYYSSMVFREQLGSLKETVLNSTRAQVLTSFNQMYSMATSLVQQAERHIRVTSTGAELHAPGAYVDGMAEKLRNSYERGTPIRLDATVAADFKTAAMALHKKVEQRRQAYTGGGVENLVEFRALDIPWALDFLCVDSRHLVIKFPPPGDKDEFTIGIAFINEPDVVREFVRWYDRFLYDKSISWKEFCSAYPAEGPQDEE